MRMESSKDVEVLSKAIEKLLDEKRKRDADGDSFIEDHDDQLLLSTLLSQLESSSPKPLQKTIQTTKEEEEERSRDSSPSKGKREDGKRDLEESIEAIAKDIKDVKRQNKVTNILLTSLIILTLTWQLSEFSLIYMMKDRLSHPVRSIGGMLSGMFKAKIRPLKNQLPGTSSSKEQNNSNGTNAGVNIQVPDLLREFGFDDEDER